AHVAPLGDHGRERKGRGGPRPRRRGAPADPSARSIVRVHLGLPADDLVRRHARVLSDGHPGGRPLRHRDRAVLSPRALRGELRRSRTDIAGRVRQGDPMKRFFVPLVLAALVGGGVAYAADPELKTEDDKTIYALGLVIANQLAGFKLTPAEIDLVKA